MGGNDFRMGDPLTGHKTPPGRRLVHATGLHRDERQLPLGIRPRAGNVPQGHVFPHCRFSVPVLIAVHLTG